MISFIQTGGTIDKDYPKTTKGWAFEIGEPAVKRILTCWNPPFNYEIVELLKKDSLEITNADRNLLQQAINRSANQHIVVTHGTDTMIETAEFLAANTDNKCIVITGAMRPERFTNSDAAINVGAAVGGLLVSHPGVYICMNGIFKPWNDISRNSEGQFY